MDWKKFSKNMLPLYAVYDLSREIKEHGFVEGFKEKTKEMLIENMPIVGHIYDLGKNEGIHNGKKEGYVSASIEFYKKLMKQTEEFFQQIDSMSNNIELKNKLLDEYEKCIAELESSRVTLPTQEQIVLDDLKSYRNRLIAIT